METNFLGLDNYISAVAVVRHASEAEVRPHLRLSLAEAALNAPAATLRGVELYPHFTQKVAVLGARAACCGGCPGHDAHVSLILMAYFATINERVLLIEDDDVARVLELLERISGTAGDDELHRWVERHLHDLHAAA